jgi:hypothetical protein
MLLLIESHEQLARVKHGKLEKVTTRNVEKFSRAAPPYQKRAL